MTKKNKNNAGKLRVILLLLVTMIAIGGGFFGYTFFIAEKGPDNEMTNIHLKEETIAFVYTSMPDMYRCLSEINNEVVIIHKELERLEKIEKEYPKQKSIVISEKKLWGKTLKDLETTIENLEKNIKTLYVAYTVNREKGAELLESQNTELLASATEILEASKHQTKRLKNAEEKSLIDKIKEKISK